MFNFLQSIQNAFFRPSLADNNLPKVTILVEVFNWANQPDNLVFISGKKEPETPSNSQLEQLKKLEHLTFKIPYGHCSIFPSNLFPGCFWRFSRRTSLEEYEVREFFVHNWYKEFTGLMWDASHYPQCIVILHPYEKYGWSILGIVIPMSNDHMKELEEKLQSLARLLP